MIKDFNYQSEVEGFKSSHLQFTHTHTHTNLTFNELIMKIMQSSFIHCFIHFTHEYHALKTCLTHKKMC
jgi:hypothetical protein